MGNIQTRNISHISHKKSNKTRKIRPLDTEEELIHSGETNKSGSYNRMNKKNRNRSDHPYEYIDTPTSITQKTPPRSPKKFSVYDRLMKTPPRSTKKSGPYNKLDRKTPIRKAIKSGTVKRRIANINKP